MPAFAQNMYAMAKFELNRRRFKSYTIKRKIAGMSFTFFIADPVGKEWYDVSAKSWPEMDFLKKNLLRKGDIILECGAHHGVTTSLFAKAIGPSGHVYAFEPSPFNVGIIKKNAELNNLHNVTVVNEAIGDKPSEAQFSYFSNASIQIGKIGTYKAKINTIDSYADVKPTMLKIDVEGFDVEALKGAKKVLKTRPKIALEIHTAQLSNFGHSVKDIFNLLDLKDYDCTIMTDGQFLPLSQVKEITSNVHLFAVPR